MASQAYYDWLNAGKPFRLIPWLVALRDTLRRYGYTVYDIGNPAHQQAEPPEDHMPYSATGWPSTSPRWWGHALDIMPPTASSGLPSLAQLGAQIHADRQASHAGTAGLKYMNWEPSGSGGPCYHDSWQPSYRRTSSGDRGHIHLSGRTDITTAPAYDPVARIRGGTAMAWEPTLHEVINAILNGSTDKGYVTGKEARDGEAGSVTIAAGVNLRVVIDKLNQLLARPSAPAVDVPALASAIVAKLPATSLTAADVRAVVVDVLLHGASTK